MDPLLSILIPTKDRYKTLFPVLIGMVKDFKNLDVEFIIQDNTENNNDLKELLSKLIDFNIKYFHIPNQISMTENCDYSVKNSKGKYLIMIGDDDYVMPSIIDVIKLMQENEIECLNSNTASYYWPNVTFKHQTQMSKPATLIVSKPIKKEFISLDSKMELQKVINSGGTDYANLPRLYHGIVKRIVLDRIYENCQTYFPGPSPDMANSTALAIFTKNFYIYNYPFSISGKSNLSAAGLGVNHAHVGDLNQKTFLDKKLLAKWDEKVPYFWSGDTIYAQSLIHSLKACDYEKKINFNCLYAHLFVYERHSIIKKMDTIKISIKTNPINMLFITYWSMIYLIKRYTNYFKNKFCANYYFKIFNNVTKIEDSINLLRNITS